jgi:hypothetical protein
MTRDTTAHLARSLLIAGAMLLAEGAGAAPEAPPSPAPPQEPPPPENDPYRPPKGSPEDMALWESMGAAHGRMQSSRNWAIKTLGDLQVARYDKQLDKVAKGAAPADAERLVALRNRFVTAWDKDYALLTRQWPVDPRLGCRRQRLDLETFMETTLPELKVARAECKDCLGRMEPATAAMEAANRDLGAVLVEVKAALAPAPAQATPPTPEPEKR